MAVVPIKVPQVSESISEGILASWLKPDGSFVKSGEPLYELETDKASQVFIAPAAGILKIQVAEGSTVAVETVIGSIDP
jgi:2-oxoglutarate dehydrogenase E2 component (dihydrolipoamide succinyltransferase)